jgi:hypothetical protein
MRPKKNNFLGGKDKDSNRSQAVSDNVSVYSRKS